MLIIGIDPDVDKSGFSYSLNGKIYLFNLKYFEIFEELLRLKNENKNLLVLIECGFLNNSNWHIKIAKSNKYNAKIGENTGRNFEVAYKLIELCEYLKIDYKKIKPISNKLKAEDFNKITGFVGRSNQESRDAYMLVYRYNSINHLINKQRKTTI